MPTTADTIFRNARIGMGNQVADSVCVSSGVITAVGKSADLMRMAGTRTTVIDCDGRALVPGIVDSHCHVFAAAETLNRVDCRPSATPTVESIVAALRAAGAGSEGWIRGYGYDDSTLGLGRHLNRHDLDAVSTEHPVRVDHRSGHATVLNSAGLRTIGVSRETPDPPGGTIMRDDGGFATGLLLDMSDWLRERVGESAAADSAGFRSALRTLGQRMLAYGITAMTDAGPENGLERWQAFAAFMDAGLLPLRVTMMVGHTRLGEMREAGLRHGDVAGGGSLAIGHAKVMLTASSGRLHPHPEELSEIVSMTHGMGFPVAIHAVEQDAVVAAALAITDDPVPVGRDRIEHCAECPPDVGELVAQSGARVVTNSGFLHYEGERYLKTLPEGLLPHLYPAGALAGVGIPVALASDAPVVEPNPWAAMAAAVTRRTSTGAHLGGIGLPSVGNALRKHTGSNGVAPGYPADLAVVEPDPATLSSDDLPAVRAVLTMVAGRVAWRSGI